MSEVIVVVTYKVFWPGCSGLSRGSFATNWAAILYAVPLDMVGTVTLEALNCSSGVWTDVMRVLQSRQISKSHKAPTV